MSNLTTQELMDELSSKLILKSEENEILCPTCNGLQFAYRQQKDNGYIQGCTDCHNGLNYVCKHCGKSNKTDHCECEKAEQERRSAYNNIELEKNQKLFSKATKIKFNDYKGKFILENDDFIKDSDDVFQWLYDKIKYEGLSDEELPKFLWSTNPEPVFTLDVEDIILDKCEDGYDDMYSHLDTCDEDLLKAQEYLNKWYDKQGDMVNTYYEDYSIAVLLGDLIKEIREDIEKEDLK